MPFPPKTSWEDHRRNPYIICDAIEADVPVYLKGIQRAEDALQAKIERNTWVDMTAWWQFFQICFELEDVSFLLMRRIW